MKYARYPKYKDSGVEWLGEIPEGWDVKSIKWISPVQRGASPRPIDDPKYFDDDGEYAWVRISDVTASETGYLQETTEKLSELGSSLSVKLEPGSLFISIAGTVGKPCITMIKACIHDGFVYMPALTINPRFLFRIFESGACYGGLGKFGTQLNLNTDTIGSIRVGIPPKNEISKLLSFLDTETAKIDGLIKDYEELIELLQEKRQALISHAVTRGLSELVSLEDPEFGEWAKPVTFKDSGVEWLGEIPEGWEVCGFSHRLESFIDYRGRTPDKIDSGRRLITARNIKNGKIDYEVSEEYMSEEEYLLFMTRGMPKINDILMTTEAPLGQFALVDDTSIGLAQRIVKISGDPNFLDNRYLIKYFMSLNYQYALFSYASGSTAMGIKTERLSYLRILVPPLHTQKVIVSFLDMQISKMDNLITETLSSIDLLKEHRAALITNAVTGKINVEGLASTR